MTAYLSAVNDMPDLFSATYNVKGRIYKCLAGTIYKVRFKFLSTFSDWLVYGEPTGLYIKLLQYMKNVEARYETDIHRYFTASTNIRLLSMSMLKFKVIFVMGLISYIINTYTTIDQAFSYTTEAWDLVWFFAE